MSTLVQPTHSIATLILGRIKDILYVPYTVFSFAHFCYIQLKDGRNDRVGALTEVRKEIGTEGCMKLS